MTRLLRPTAITSPFLRPGRAFAAVSSGLLTVALLAPTSLAAVITVPGDYLTIQAAISAPGTVVGDEVVVDPGTYFEVIDFQGKAITVRSAGGADVTTIDGTGLGDSVVTCTSGESADTVLDGFTITGGEGKPAGAVPTLYNGPVGGGMCISFASPTVTGCVFRQNAAVTAGGLFAESGSPTVSGCTFQDNAGGGLFLDIGAPVLTTCAFEQHDATAVTLYSCSPTMSQCTFEANASGMVLDGVTGTLSDCTFVGNADEGLFVTASDGLQLIGCEFRRNGGGGVEHIYSDTEMVGCRFIGNTSSGSGGGLFALSEESADHRITMRNCLFLGNRADQRGGAIYSDQHLFTAVNCTFAENTAIAGAHVIQLEAPCYDKFCEFPGLQAVMQNCIVDFFFPATQSDGSFWVTGSPNYSDDPLFVQAPVPGLDGVWGTDDDVYDLRLRADSPCVDAGNTAAVGGLATDLAGNPRVMGAPPVVDIGAYEYQCGGDCDEDGVDDCEQISFDPTLDGDANGVLDACETTCPADLDDSGGVGFGDLTQVLNAWGPCNSICECTTSQTTWQNESLGTFTGNFTVEFDHTPLLASTDAVVTLGKSPLSGPTFDDYAMLVRLDPNGYYNVRNGNTYARDAEVFYTAGVTNRIRIEADIPANTYSVWVTPDGGVETQIASNYAFRTAQQGITEIDTLGAWGVDPDAFTMCDVVYGNDGALGSCPCLPDLDGSGTVGFSDLTQLIALWGACP